MHAKVIKQSVDEEIVRRYVEEVIPPVQDQLEKLFVASGFANPAAITVAELAVWSSFVNLEHAEIPFDADRWPKLGAFLAAMDEHPVLAPLIAEERASLASL